MNGQALLASVVSVALLGDASPGGQGVERLAWMAGCWELRSGDLIVDEQWMEPRGGTMLGMSRTVRRDRTVAYETVLLVADSGGITYRAMPSGQPAAAFPAVEVSDSHVVFSNPLHDFPQRIIYRRRGDSLAARIEGLRNGVLRGSNYPFARRRCPGTGA
ncbi:MAG TPA: DUF6265 family protein [Gemmatimonadales bacterium]|nr:DUF6265 family protein [Gemmatimonadales bacterium]